MSYLWELRIMPDNGSETISHTKAVKAFKDLIELCQDHGMGEIEIQKAIFEAMRKESISVEEVSYAEV